MIAATWDETLWLSALRLLRSAALPLDSTVRLCQRSMAESRKAESAVFCTSMYRQAVLQDGDASKLSRERLQAEPTPPSALGFEPLLPAAAAATPANDKMKRHLVLSRYWKNLPGLVSPQYVDALHR